MPNHHDDVNRHYGARDLSTRILDALREAGRDLDRLSREDLASFDEFHTGGLDATRSLAKLARLEPDMSVLDVGAGVGGPARTLAAEFGVTVVGLDLTEEFCRAAETLTRLVGLDDRATFRHGDALAMPFDDASFDAVWSQNTLMNIEDKSTFFSEVARVLKPRGLFALQSVLAGPVPEIHFPTFWASSPDLNFLTTRDETRALLRAGGFVEVVWEDVTAGVAELARARRHASRHEVLGRGILVPDDVAAKMESSFRNVTERRVVHVRAVLRREE